jgi:hypothetical protein
VTRFLTEDGLNESQPAGSIPDFETDEFLDFPSFEEAAADAEAIFAGVTEAERSCSDEDCA